MIDFWVFLPACFALNVAFGPNNLLALTHGVERGPVFALTAGVGRLAAFALMIAISSVGLGILLTASATLFTAIKLLGAAYLVYLGVRLLRSGTTAFAAPTPTDIRSATRREALIALGNPKAILIFAAFLPQFVVVDRFVESSLIVGAAFLVMETVAILLYGLAGHFVRSAAMKRVGLIRKGSGIGMIVFGIVLLFARQPQQTTS